MLKTVAYLALGDSYTIGEGVLPTENFPSQLKAVLQHGGLNVGEVTIVAKTGWTTSELSAAIEDACITREYQLVTLLIGVNNQYRGMDIGQYEKEFAGLLKKAILFAGGDVKLVYVLSIPDWSATPFASKYDCATISTEISEFNKVNYRIATEAGVGYCNITADAPGDSASLAADLLHPSAKEYSRWVQLLSQLILQDNQLA